jgi:Glycosyl transferase family 2
MSSAPDEVRAWAQARSEARGAREWAEADRLRAAIEAAGWRVVDQGTRFSLEPAHAPDIVEEGRIRYGASDAVPARLEEPPVGTISVILVATDRSADLARTLAGLRQHALAGCQVVIVADRPDPDQEAALLDPGGPAAAPIADASPEIVWTSERLGRAGAINAGLRRAAAPIVLLLDTSVELTGDLLGPLIAALDDPAVAVVGPWGLVSDDLRRFDRAEPGEVDAIDGGALAFRRADLLARGRLDERFTLGLNLDIWWSLVLRDGDEDQPARRAIAIGDLAVQRHDAEPDASVDLAERDRLARRSFYRVLDRFGARRDLLVSGGGPSA